MQDSAFFFSDLKKKLLNINYFNWYCFLLESGLQNDKIKYDITNCHHDIIFRNVCSCHVSFVMLSLCFELHVNVIFGPREDFCIKATGTEISELKKRCLDFNQYYLSRSRVLL